MPWTEAIAANSPEDLLREIQTLLASQQLSFAEQKLQDGIETFHGDPRLYNALGIVKAQQGDFPAAEKYFRKAVDEAPRFTDAYLNLGRLYQQNAGTPGSLDKAIDAYTAIVASDPDHLEANYQLAVLLQRKGDYKQSQAHLTRLPEEAQRRAQALSIRCANLAALGDEPAAQQAGQRLLQSTDLSELDVTSILPVLERAHQPDLTRQLLEGLAEKQKASAASLRRLGLLHENGGDLTRARANLEKAAAGFQNNLVPLLQDLARVAYKQKDYKGTLGYLAHARDLEPNNAAIHFFFGMVCVDMDLVAEAHNSLQKAVELAPDRPYYNYALGAVLSTQRNAGSAVPYLEKYLQAKPNDPRGRLTLGVAFYRNADLERARKELLAVADDDATAAAANYFLGRIALRGQQMEEAVTRFQKAVDHAPDYADAYADLGLAYIRQSQYEPAEKALDKAVEIEPDGYRGNLNLLLLYERTKDPRSDAQKQKFDRLKKEQEEKMDLVMRSIEVRPY